MLPNNCETPADIPSFTVDEAKAQIDASIDAILRTETIALLDAHGRVLSRDVIAPINVPPHDNSAMDGYATAAPTTITAGTYLTCIGEALAGHPFNGSINENECIRIMTGAQMPDDATAVVMQERTEKKDQQILCQTDIQSGDNIRRAGEDIQSGQVLLKQGTLLGAADCGLLASIGINEIDVYKIVRIALIATGDELQAAGNELQAGQIYESNRYVIRGLLNTLPVTIEDYGIIADNPDSIEQTLLDASQKNDLIITSGGVSIGDADYVQRIMNKRGSLNFWKIAIKPGKPLAFGRLGQAVFFGLPGNPVSASTTFLLFARRAIAGLAGINEYSEQTFYATCSHAIHKKPGREEYQRGVLSLNESTLSVSSTGNQGSHVLTSMSNGNCFIVLERESDGAHEGQSVKVMPFSQWGL